MQAVPILKDCFFFKEKEKEKRKHFMHVASQPGWNGSNEEGEVKMSNDVNEQQGMVKQKKSGLTHR